ncbi:MAG: amino acid ABC transporter substrate-binding protein [Gammaproteobacteria bacterium]|jgi:branched-chain amino acid transport system substrate-binding protein
MRLLLTLIVAFAGLVTVAPSAAETAPPIRVGATVSLSGEYELLGLDQLQGMQMWADDVNRRGALLGRKVEIVYYDDGSDPEQSARLYERLITEDRVDLLLGPYSSDITYAASAVAERHGFPMVATGAAASKIWSRGFSNIFQIDTPADRYMDLPLKFAHDNGLTRVAILHGDAEFPREVAAGARRKARELGMAVVFDAEYPGQTEDFKSLVESLATADPEVLIGGTYLDDSVRLVGVVRDAGLTPGVVALTVGPAQRTFGAALGEDAENVMGVVAWMRSGFLPMAYDFSYRYKAKFGVNAAVHAAYGYAGGQVLEAAVRLAGSLDRDAVREQLRTMTFRSILGPYRVDENGAQMAKETYVLQWQTGYRLLILPEQLRDAPAVFPYR